SEGDVNQNSNQRVQGRHDRLPPKISTDLGGDAFGSCNLEFAGKLFGQSLGYLLPADTHVLVLCGLSQLNLKLTAATRSLDSLDAGVRQQVSNTPDVHRFIELHENLSSALEVQPVLKLALCDQ